MTHVGIGDAVRFDYHDKARSSRIESIGRGPSGVYVTVEQVDGSHKTFSQPKISNLRKT